jgi:two-component system, OmpR family, sensor kinase
VWDTESPRKFDWPMAGALAVFIVVVATLWRFPDAELITFHVVWLGLALLTLRNPSPRWHSWLLVAAVTVMAIVLEIVDVRTGAEGVEGLIEIPLDLTAFVALVFLARRHHRALALEHDAAVQEHSRNARQRTFFANASHALRTPITVARGHAEMALQESGQASVKIDLMVVLDELDRLTRATERLMKLSVAGELDSQHREPLDVDLFVHSMITRWRPTAPRQWKVSAETRGRWILGDREQLTEALDAIIENAMLATQPGATIDVRADVDGDTVVLAVSDDGPGVSGIDTDRLFDAFQQGPRRESLGGTGLGLAIVRAIAQAHGGDVALESNSPTGTTVRMRLPVTEHEEVPKPSAGNGGQASPGKQAPVATSVTPR